MASPVPETVELPALPLPSNFSLEDAFELDSGSNIDGVDDSLPALTPQMTSESMSSGTSIETAADSILGLFGLGPMIFDAGSSVESVVDQAAPVVFSAFEAGVERARKARALALTGGLPGQTSRLKTLVCVKLPIFRPPPLPAFLCSAHTRWLSPSTAAAELARSTQPEPCPMLRRPTAPPQRRSSLLTLRRWPRLPPSNLRSKARSRPGWRGFANSSASAPPALRRPGLSTTTGSCSVKTLLRPAATRLAPVGVVLKPNVPP